MDGLCELWMLVRLGTNLTPTIVFAACKMGAYKYIGELYKKKQSDVLRFLMRVRYVFYIFPLKLAYELPLGAGNTAS